MTNESLAAGRKSDADAACGFAIGTSTVYRSEREAITLLAAMAPTLAEAIEVARGTAFVILDGTLLRIDRVGMASGRDRAFYSGKHKCHGVNRLSLQRIARRCLLIAEMELRVGRAIARFMQRASHREVAPPEEIAERRHRLSSRAVP